MKFHYEPSHQCEVCQKSFYNTSDLTRHMRTHSGVKPYVCPFCDKRFATKSDLKKHQATHSNERKFKCNICPDERYFKTKGQLRKHLVYHYEPKHSCLHCNKKCHTLTDLTKHLKRKHVCKI